MRPAESRGNVSDLEIRALGHRAVAERKQRHLGVAREPACQVGGAHLVSTERRIRIAW